MLLAPTLIISSLAGILFPQVSAAHSSTSPTRTHHSRLDGRQDLLDLCIDIPNLAVALLDELLGIDLDLCLCIHNLDIYLQTTVNVTLQNNALANINALLGVAGAGQCTQLPPHAHRAFCNEHDPCQYVCDDGYVACGDQCVLTSAQCPSARARSLKPRAQKITTMVQAQAYCKTLSGGRTTVCGVENGGPNDFECVNVENDLESCGGCMVNPPFLPKSMVLPTGRNCAAIPNAINASCEKSNCKVQYRGSSALAQNKAAHTITRKRMHKEVRAAPMVDLELLNRDSSTSASSPMLSPAAASAMLKLLGATNKAASSPVPAGYQPLLDLVTLGIRVVVASSPEAIPSSATSALNSTATAQAALTKCGCGSDLLSSLDDVTQALLELLALCPGSGSSPSGTPTGSSGASTSSSSSSSGAPTVPGPPPASCTLDTDLDSLLCGLGDLVVDSSLLCALGSLTPDLQHLINSLGLGPGFKGCSTSSTSSASAPAGSPSSETSSDPASLSSVLSDISIVLALCGQASSDGSNVTSCDACSGDADLLASTYALLNSLDDYLGLGGILQLGERQLDLGNLLGGVSPLLNGLGLGGATGESSGDSSLDSSLGSLTDALDLNGLLASLDPLVKDSLSALGLASSSCASSPAGLSLASTLNSLGPALNSLTSDLETCGCSKDPAVANAFSKAASTPAKRSRRGHVNFL